ncbi:MAG: response regulator, partial [Pseudomonadota bacterium]
GFTVSECASGGEAVTLYDAIGDTVDVVLLDMRMPGGDGMTAYRSLRERSDDQRVVLMSGLDAAPSSALSDDAALSFLQKPFEGRTLVNCVLDALSVG